MRIFKTKVFARDAKTERLSDEALNDAINEVSKGLFDAALGGNLVKKRVAIASKGKSGGVRTILVYKGPTANVFCIYVFAKTEKANISQTELQQLKVLAKFLMSKTENEITHALKIGALQEVT